MCVLRASYKLGIADDSWDEGFAVVVELHRLGSRKRLVLFLWLQDGGGCSECWLEHIAAAGFAGFDPFVGVVMRE